MFLALGSVLIFMALFSYSPDDSGWASSKPGAAANAAGQFGAVVADVLFHFLGYLAFAIPLLILAKLGMMFRQPSSSTSYGWLFRILGFMATLCALCALTSVSIIEGSDLPVGAGGALGVAVFGGMSPMFGFPGTIVILLALLALGLMLFLEFSWMLLFEQIGSVVLGLGGKGAKNADEDESDADFQDEILALPEPENIPTEKPKKRASARRSSKARQASRSDLVSESDSVANAESAEPFTALEQEYIAEQAAAEQHTEADEVVREPLEPVLLDPDELPGMEREINVQAVADTAEQAKEDVEEDAVVTAAEEPPVVADQVYVQSEPAEGIPPADIPVLTDSEADLESVPEVETADDIPWDVSDDTMVDAIEEADVEPVVMDEIAAESASKSEQDIPVEPLEKRAGSELLDAATIRKHARELGLPSIEVLDPPRTDQLSGFSAERLQDLSALLVQKLADFGVKIEVVAVAPGPVITRFEIQPAPGVKASKITNLAKDLARSMAMISVRVVEVIPGKSVMGIEVPNENRAIVSLSDVLASSAFDKSESVLTLALGHDIGGNPVVANLAKMPHLLVAGTTGSGKSVGVNAMILSMLFKATPEQLRLIMVDPKMLELSVYEGIPHLLCPVITDMKEAANGLRWCVEEMERRYQLLASQGVRNIVSYNRKVQAAMDAGQPILDPLWSIETSYDPTPRTLEPLPFIVIVVDEFADMMMMVGKKVEEYIARIAQKARAAGIHMILATQRPSVDVITGLIKANVPTRIAFQVSSRIDSRTILDQGGAEQLLGHGDMLFMPPGLALPERVHGAFVDDDEVHRVVAEWKLRDSPDYIEAITQGEETAAGGAGGAADGDERDELFDQAVAFVTETGKCSASGLQRRMRIGYNRAARLVEAMEAAGIVSSPGNNGAREVLAPPPPEVN